MTFQSLLNVLILVLSLHSFLAMSNGTQSNEDASLLLRNIQESLNYTDIYNNGTQELKYYPDEGRGADGYISSFFESFWPFRTHKSNLHPSFTPSPLLEVSTSKKDTFVKNFCEGRFQGDLEDLRKALNEFKIHFTSDLYALHSLLCTESNSNRNTQSTTKSPYYESEEIITKSQREFVVQSGFSYDSKEEKRDYYPVGGGIQSRLDEMENPFFIPSNRRSDSDRSLNSNNRYRKINLNRQSPPKPAIMSDNDVKFYPATVQDFLDAPGRPFIKKLPTLELRQKGPSLSFPHFPRRLAPEQKITPRFPTKVSSTTTPRTTTATLRPFSKFIAYDANPDATRKRVVIKPRKHINHGPGGTRRSRIRIPVRKNPYENEKEDKDKTERGAINISTVLHDHPKPLMDSHSPFDSEGSSSIKQFGAPQNVRLTPYSNSMFIRSSTSTTSRAPSITPITTTMFTPPSTTAPPFTTTSVKVPLDIQPSSIYSDVIQEISAPTSFISPEDYVFGAKQGVQSEPFLPEEALLLENDVFGRFITTEKPDTETTLAASSEESPTTFRVVSAEDFELPSSSTPPSIEFKLEKVSSNYYDDIETIIGDLSDVASPSPVEDIHPKSKGSAQKLAYILIGVCCGLSILCLIVVVVSLGYKSERSFMGEEYRRNLFRRIMTGYLSNGRTRFSSGSSHSSIHEKTSTSRLTGATNSAEKGSEEQPSHKLGSWFNGKLHNIQTLDRKKKEKVFPTNVYLDNLNDLTRISDNESKKTSKDEIENEEDDAFSVEELFESRSKVVSNASSSSPSMSVKSIPKESSSQVTTKAEVTSLGVNKEDSDPGDGISSCSFPPPPPPLEPEQSLNDDSEQKKDKKTPQKTDDKTDDEEDEIVLSENNDRLI